MSITTSTPVVAPVAPKATPATPKAAPKAAAKPKATPKPKVAPKAARKDAAHYAGKDFTYLADKKPTDLHVDFAAWLQAEVGVEVDVKTVQLVSVLRMAYQASEQNQANLQQRTAEAKAKQAARQAAKDAKDKAELARLQAKFAPKK